MRDHAPALAAIALALFVFAGFLTYGAWDFGRTEPMARIYDAQADSLMHGRWDIPLDAIPWEAYVRDGRAYTYWGPTPALPRMALNRVFPGMYGRWTALSLLLTCALNLAVAWLLVRLIRERFYPAAPRDGLTSIATGVFLLACGLGSTNIQLASRQYIYHESIAWGATLALLSYYCLLRYLSSSGSLLTLLMAGAFSYLSFFARLSSGSGTVLALLCVLAGLLAGRIGETRRRMGHAAALVGFVTLTAASYLLVNYFRFGSPWDPQPIRFHVGYSDEFLARLGGTFVHPENAWFNFRQYFLKPNLRWEPSFPWVYLQDPRRVDTSGLKFDDVEPFVSLPASAVALSALALVGLLLALRSKRGGVWPLVLVMLTSLQGGLAILVMARTSLRYLHDFYPFLVIAGAAGLCEITNWNELRRRWAFRFALVPLAGISLFVNLAFVFDSEAHWVARLRRWRARIDRAVDLGPLQPIQTDISRLPRHATYGSLLRLDAGESVYWYDGEKWRHVAGRELGQFHLQVRFPERIQRREPLLAAGRQGACDLLYVEEEAPRSVRFGFAHGLEEWSSDLPVPINPGRESRLDATLDHLNHQVEVTLDDDSVLSWQTELYAWNDGDVTLGTNITGCRAEQKFAGTITRLPTLIPR